MNDVINRAVDRARAAVVEELDRINRPHFSREEVKAIFEAKAEDAIRRGVFGELVALGKDGRYGWVLAERGAICHPGEPLFPIRGRDLSAQDAIKAYAEIAQAKGASPNLIVGASQAHAEIREWQIANPSHVHVPDLP